MATAAIATLLAVGLLLAAATPAVAQAEVSGSGDGAIEIVLFHSETCPHCRAEREYLTDLVIRYPEVTVTAYELSQSEENRELLSTVAAEMAFDPSGVPITIFQGQVWIGFSPAMVEALEVAVVAAIGQPMATPDPPASDAAAADAPMGPVAPATAAPDDSADPDGAPAPDDTTVQVPLAGDVDVGEWSLVLSTVLLAGLDGVNPCSLWVLSLLLALVVHTGSRRRVFLVGAVFLTITTALYGLYMVGVYSILSYIAYTTWIRVGVAAVAGGLGVVNLLDAFGRDLPVRLRIPDSRKPRIYQRMRTATRSGSLVGTIGATSALAVGVSLVETPCTAGFPVMWTNLLAAHDVGVAGAVMLFGLYMLVFLLDELVIFFAAVLTLRAAKLQERQGTMLKLAGGVVMIVLAGTMILAPDVLASMGGTLLVFGGATALTLALGWWLRRRPHHPAAV